MENQFEALSSIQKSIWITQSKYPHSSVFNVGGYAEIKGHLNVTALKEAICARLNSCDIINGGWPGRAIISTNGNGTPGYTIEYTDFSGEKDPARFCKGYLEQDLCKAVGMDHPLQVKILKSSDMHFFWYVKVHHLFFDGYAMSLFFNDVCSAYSRILNDPEEYIDLSSYSYSKYITEEKKYKSSPEYINDKAFWLNRLQGIGDLNSSFLSCSKNNKADSLSSERLELVLPRATFNQIKSLCTSNGNCSPFHYFIAIIVLLNKYYNNPDITIGLPVFNRSSKLQKQTLGTFINTLPFSIVLPEHLTFAQLLKTVKEETRALFRHQKFPIADLSDEIDLSNNVYNILFSYQKLAYQNSLDGLDFSITYLHNKEQLEDIAIHLLEYSEEEDLLLCFDYKTGHFDKSVIQNLIRHFDSLTQLFLKDPGISIGAPEYMAVRERQELLETFNDTKVKYQKAKTIVELFEQQAKADPAKTAIVCGTKALSYLELNERSNQLARYLRENYLVKPDDLIGIKVDRNEWMIISILAILKSGGAYVPIDPDYPQERIDYMVADSRCRVVLDDAELQKFDAGSGNYEKDDLKHVNSPRDLAYVIYTSGSTGKPKGVMVEHGSLVNFLENMEHRFAFDESIAFGAITNFTFDISVLELICTVTKGIKTFLIPEKEPAGILNYIKEHSINALQITPSRLNQFLELSPGSLEAFNQLKILLIGGEPLSETNYIRLKKLNGVKVINVYGPTETTIWSSCSDITTSSQLTIGKALVNEQIYILGNNNNLLPLGVAGEICIGGDSLARGYLNKPELTKEKFVAHPFKPAERIYKTGDLGRRLPDGNIEFIGRKDDQVKIRGYRVESGEIEHLLGQYPGVESCLVLARANSAGEQELIAYLVSRDTFNITALRTYLSNSLPAYMVPSYFIRLDKMPLANNGKINRKALPVPEDSGMSTGTEYVAASNATEEKLLAIWSEVLGIGKEKISVKDNFFEIGGHSLKATRLVSRIHKEFEVRTELKDLFSNVTITQQATLISQSAKSRFENIAPAQLHDSYPLSSSQRRLWVLCQFQESSMAYNMPGVYVFEGIFNKEALGHSFKMLIERHEILRTVFKEDETGEVRQWIQTAEALDFSITYQDLRTDADREEKVKGPVQAFSEKAFDLSAGPLLRASLYQVEENKHVFSYVMHHIISDGWSMEILIREVLSFYNAYVKNEETALAPLPVQYKDYSVWQQQELSAERLKSHKEYWLKQFEGELPVLELQGDKPRPAVKTYNGSSLSCTIGKELSGELKAISQLQGGTLFMGLLAAVNTLLYRYTGQEDMITGSPIAGREHSDLENQIGFYLNTLALRARFSGGDSYTSLLDKIRQLT
ncbi:MAG: Nonribosomal peptide synthetase, partial [Bacteroidetes bacterium]|nr:Nonribosomal peptide synthetase [Bacteroidota bacterium]